MPRGLSCTGADRRDEHSRPKQREPTEVDRAQLTKPLLQWRILLQWQASLLLRLTILPRLRKLLRQRETELAA